MYFVDSNIFLRFLTGDDPKTFKDCFLFLEQIKTNKIRGITGGLILAEVAWTLQSFYGVPKSEIVQGLQGILDLRGMKIVDSYEYQEALRMYQKHNVKYIDACITSIPEVFKKEWVVVSYDKDFDKLGIKRKEPQDII